MSIFVKITMPCQPRQTGHRFFNRLTHVITVVVALFAFPDCGWADQGNPDGNTETVNLHGFMSVIGGEVLSGSFDGKMGGQNFQCPCYIGDWANAGVYTRQFSLEPQSHIGIQADYAVDRQLSFSGQTMVRGTEHTPSVEYAYVEYKFDGQWSVHIGRERIPLYYYSVFQDLGLAYPWVAPPSEIYGWEATNYNGLSTRYKGDVHDVNVSAELYTGFEYAHDSPFVELNYNVHSNIRWKNMVGAVLELSRDFWTIRANAMTAQSDWDNLPVNGQKFARLRVAGVAANLNFDNWFIVSEAGQFQRDYDSAGFAESNPSYTIGVGFPYGAWTPVINYAKVDDYFTYHTAQAVRQIDSPSAGWSFTLRYDINPSSAVKIQYDKNQDLSPESNFFGNAKVLRLSYDRVF